MAKDTDDKVKNWIRRLREKLLKLSEGAKTGGRPGLEQIEELMTEEEKKKKK